MPGVLLCCSMHQALKGAPWVGVLLCSSVHQVFDWPASLLSSCNAGVWGKIGYGDDSTTACDSAVSSCSMAAWLSSTGISHPDLLPPITSICLSTVNSSPHPGIAPQPLNSSSQPLHLLGDWHCIAVWGMYGCGKDCLIFTPFMLPLISCFTLSLKCFSSDSDSCPDMRIGPLLQFPHPPRVRLILLTLLVFPLVPSSY